MQIPLVMTIISPDRTGLVEAVARAVADHGGNWLESRMCRLGGEFAGILRVEIPAAGLSISLDEDETIWTESSHKYRIGEAVEMGERTGFRCEGQWVDEEWPFAQNLLMVE